MSTAFRNRPQSLQHGRGPCGDLEHTSQSGRVPLVPHLGPGKPLPSIRGLSENAAKTHRSATHLSNPATPAPQTDPTGDHFPAIQPLYAENVQEYAGISIKSSKYAGIFKNVQKYHPNFRARPQKVLTRAPFSETPRSKNPNGAGAPRATEELFRQQF